MLELGAVGRHSYRVNFSFFPLQFFLCLFLSCRMWISGNHWHGTRRSKSRKWVGNTTTQRCMKQVLSCLSLHRRLVHMMMWYVCYCHVASMSKLGPQIPVSEVVVFGGFSRSIVSSLVVEIFVLEKLHSNKVSPFGAKGGFDCVPQCKWVCLIDWLTDW